MKTTQTLTAVAAGLLLAGCGPQPARDAPEPPKPTVNMTPEVSTPPLPELPTVSQESLKPMTGREQFLASVEKKLKDLDEQVAGIKNLIEPSDEYAKTSATAWDELRTKAGTKYSEIKQAGEGAWETIKPELDALMTELEKSYKDLKSKVST